MPTASSVSSDQTSSKENIMRVGNLVGACIFRYFVTLFVLVTSIFVTGCSTTSVLPDTATQSSVIDYTQALRRSTAAGLDALLVQISTSPAAYPDYKVWQDWWCPRHAEVHSVKAVQDKLGDYCQHGGGSYVAPFCRSVTNPDSVAFYAVVTNNADCQGMAEPVSVRIVEPNPGKIMSPDYIAVLRKAGYQTQAEIAATAEQHRLIELANAQTLRDLEREQQRHLLEDRISKSTPIGTKVCLRGSGSVDRNTGYLVMGKPQTRREDGTLEYMGFLEGRSGTRIQLRIGGMRFISTTGKVESMASSDFRGSTLSAGSILWDDASSWLVCN